MQAEWTVSDAQLKLPNNKFSPLSILLMQLEAMNAGLICYYVQTK